MGALAVEDETQVGMTPGGDGAGSDVPVDAQEGGQGLVLLEGGVAALHAAAEVEDQDGEGALLDEGGGDGCGGEGAGLLYGFMEFAGEGLGVPSEINGGKHREQCDYS